LQPRYQAACNLFKTGLSFPPPPEQLISIKRHLPHIIIKDKEIVLNENLLAFCIILENARSDVSVTDTFFEQLQESTIQSVKFRNAFVDVKDCIEKSYTTSEHDTNNLAQLRLSTLLWYDIQQYYINPKIQQHRTETAQDIKKAVFGTGWLHMTFASLLFGLRYFGVHVIAVPWP
jgi:hypothetical protein